MACYYYNYFSYCLDLKIFIPLIGPLLTLMLGILALPFIEKVKKRIERKRLLNALKEELNDEIIHIDKSFSMIVPTFKNILAMINGEEVNGFNAVKPGSLKLYSCDSLLENHFENLNPNIRKALKVLNEKIEFLNNIDEKIDVLFHVDLKDEDLQKKMCFALGSYLGSLLVHRYDIRYLIDILNENKSKLKDPQNRIYTEAIKNQLTELDRLDILHLFNYNNN
ncbi:hypothetical protein Q5X58_09390 [Acinetobacter baumannii]|uniref:hypothetical protein n=1 Tax=Acinetobacter baumannii TaxID=470 RepID=UPI000DE637AC|nr:hypothetical protein [Acinetobacter baumannii]MDO7472426.1 hypothetical protein [Acinetobacter baumannii]MDV7658080.1 hypothetical protein [Acinetobacter baumannii]SST50166.1 Uncharacterised protein [Acinetobacter baumannii]